jgi:hypothetical protein
MMAAPDSIAHAAGLPFRTRKVRHKKLTEEQYARLKHEAEIRSQVTRNKVLAGELGLTELYVAQLISRLLAERRGHVPRLTHKFALSNPGESVERTG